MVAVRRRTGGSRPLTFEEIEHLITGYEFFAPAAPGFGEDEERMRRAWVAHRDEVLAQRERDTCRERRACPLYAELRFDRGLSRAEALAARSRRGVA